MNIRHIKREFKNKMSIIFMSRMFFLVAILASPVISADMSNWSDKTICRLTILEKGM
jgi:hypothetical protein